MSRQGLRGATDAIAPRGASGGGIDAADTDAGFDLGFDLDAGFGDATGARLGASEECRRGGGVGNGSTARGARPTSVS
jgi:hypothetical protein